MCFVVYSEKRCELFGALEYEPQELYGRPGFERSDFRSVKLRPH